MRRDPRAWLWDVREAASAIERFVAGLDATTYAHSELVHSAVERKFEVIGEALNQLSRANPDLAAHVPHLPQVVAFRNQLIHGYALIDHATVWGVIQDSLPVLLQAVTTLLAQLDAADADRLQGRFSGRTTQPVSTDSMDEAIGSEAAARNSRAAGKKQ